MIILRQKFSYFASIDIFLQIIPSLQLSEILFDSIDRHFFLDNPASRPSRDDIICLQTVAFFLCRLLTKSWFADLSEYVGGQDSRAIVVVLHLVTRFSVRWDRYGRLLKLDLNTTEMRLFSRCRNKERGRSQFPVTNVLHEPDGDGGVNEDSANHPVHLDKGKTKSRQRENSKLNCRCRPNTNSGCLQEDPASAASPALVLKEGRVFVGLQLI